MECGATFVVKDIHPRMVVEKVVNHIHVTLMTGDEEGSPARAILTIHSLLDLGARHEGQHLHEDFVVANGSAVVEDSLRILGKRKNKQK